MSGRIEYAPRVWRDLERNSDYISRDSLESAIRFYDSAEATFKELSERPGIGAIRDFPNSRLGRVRVWRISGFEKWLIYYRETLDGIEVLRVVHSSRDTPSLFDRDEPLDPAPFDT